MITLTDSAISNRQELTSGTAPDGTSLWVLSGIAATNFTAQHSAGQPGIAKESYRLLVGPVFAGPVRAIAIASAASVLTMQQALWSVKAIEADLDDETGQVQLMFEIEARIQDIGGGGGVSGYMQVNAVAYQVTIHGTAAE